MSGIEGHGVALVALTDLATRIGETVAPLLAQCECGWFARFGEVTTFAAVADAVHEHHGRVLLGIVP